MTDKITGKPRGFGFIVFESPDGVAAVLRVNAAVQSVLFVCVWVWVKSFVPKMAKMGWWLSKLTLW